MSELSPTTCWDNALRELTILPGEKAQQDFGVINFMCAGRYCRNGHQLFDEKIRPELEAGHTFKILLGFVDLTIAKELEYGNDIGYDESYSRFQSAKLANIETGEILTISILND
jgi:hypothetical protein